MTTQYLAEESAELVVKSRQMQVTLSWSAGPMPLEPGQQRCCLLLKPGVLEPEVDLVAVFDLLYRTLASRGFTVRRVLTVPGSVLRRTSIMAGHYETLHAEAITPVRARAPDALRVVSERFGAGARDNEVIGAYEALERWAVLTPSTLDEVWQESPQVRVDESCFGALTRLNGHEILLVNGFVPRLMELYARQQSVIAVHELVCAMPVQAARHTILGAPNPVTAERGTLRRELYEARDRLRIVDIRLGWNGVHMSSSQDESERELLRFEQLRTPASQRP